MTATRDDVTSNKGEPSAEAEAARELVHLAREQGLSLTGPDGLLRQLARTVIEAALIEEITGHLGYEKNGSAGQGQGGGNVRNGSRPKTVLTDLAGSGARCARPESARFEPVAQVKDVKRRFLAYSFPPRSPAPRPLAARGRPGFARAAPGPPQRCKGQARAQLQRPPRRGYGPRPAHRTAVRQHRSRFGPGHADRFSRTAPPVSH